MTGLKIVLASESPRRKQLLKKILPSFKIIASDIDENDIKIKDPVNYAMTCALKKAEEVNAKGDFDIVIGCDTIVVWRNKILGKPKNLKDAEKTLKLLSNKTNYVISGLAVINNIKNKIIRTSDKSAVKFRKLTAKEIKEYVYSEKPLDKAGSYAIQEGAGEFVNYYKGSYDNIMGLPTEKLKEILKFYCRVT